MSTKVVLLALSKVNDWFTSPSGRAAKPPQELQEQVAQALAAGLASLTATGRPRAAAAGHTNGRPPSARFSLEISNHAPRVVVGARSVVEAVNEELKLHKSQRLLTVNNLTTTISTSGAWWRNVETVNGTITIAVQRLENGTALASAQNENEP